jgi:molybdopterin/thiamine biosynthesis adenylyltransferase
MAQFDYWAAVSRNIGWVTLQEQERLRDAHVAIAGLGGVGGAHLLTLARLGIGRFTVADFDDFSVHNFNRQAGAFVSTVGQPKTRVLVQMAHDINPQAQIRVLDEGVTADNIDRFLDGVQVYVDGIDFFAMDARRMVFAACRERGIPAVTAAPLGMGSALIYFDPAGMSFERYFRLEGHDRNEQFARLIAGLSPAMLQGTYLADPSAVNFAEQRGPSTVMACDLCAGMTGTAVLKLMLRRGSLRAAPWALQFDAYRQRLKWTWRPLGNAHPLQRLLLRLIRPRLNPGA